MRILHGNATTIYMSEYKEITMIDTGNGLQAPLSATTSVTTKNAVKEKQQQASAAARQEFLAYMEKTPEERYFEAFLTARGLTKEELDAMPPKDREKILEEIQEEIERKIAEDTGADPHEADLLSGQYG